MLRRTANPNRTHFKAYVSKYALTAGIQEIDAEDCFHVSQYMIADMNNQLVTYHRGDWHVTFDQAVAKAEQMRLDKIASLKKSIGKLERLRFGLAAVS